MWSDIRYDHPLSTYLGVWSGQAHGSGCGVSIRQHEPGEPLGQIGPQAPVSGVVPQVRQLVRVVLQVVKLAPRDPIVDAEAIALGHQGAPPDASGKAEIDPLAL